MSSFETSVADASEREIFLEALEQPAGLVREAFLRAACRERPALKRSVENLLAHHQEDSFLESSIITLPDSLPRDSADSCDQSLSGANRYQILSKIGEGGCGAVYLAEQTEPLRRRVAVKVIKLGMDTKSVIARFEAERQALAIMDHPGIARVLDAGVTRKGRPFFVMDLVPGVKITQFCDEQRLGVRERLQLFIQVCHALQHAHQKGIIHRDLKPSNILVTRHEHLPLPRIIDFGVAKAIGQRLTQITVVTDLHAFIGTPAYTSPEQAGMKGLDVDTRADIYGLGVLLYELLLGVTPFSPQYLAESGLDEMRRIIREEDPLPPSRRFTAMETAERQTQAARRGIEPGRLSASLKGDLDWIVMKALEKDRRHRYSSAGEFAADVERYLKFEPVTARPPSAAYRCRKFVRRHQLACAAGAAFAMALILGISLAAWQFVEKNQAYERAVRAENEQRALRRRADRSRHNEIALRQAAEAEKIAARRRAYGADLNLAGQALAGNNLGRAQQLLEAQLPRAGEGDLRGWEWRYLWQQTRSEALFTLGRCATEINSVTASADGRWVVAGEADGGLSLWDLRTRSLARQLPKVEGPALALFSPTSETLATAGGGRAPRFAFPEGDAVNLWQGPGFTQSRELSIGSRCQGLVFSSDGRRLLVAANEELTVWDVARGSILASLAAPGMRGFFTGSAVAATDDLRLAAYSIANGGIRVVDLESGKELWSAPAADELVTALRFSPDGAVLASGAGFVESDIRLWNVAKGTEIGRLEGHRTWVSSLAFSRDGRQLISGSADQTIRVWKLGGGAESLAREEAEVLRGHEFEIWSVALLPDGVTLVSGGKDRMLCVWKLDSQSAEHSRILVKTDGGPWQFGGDDASLFTAERQGRVLRREGPEYRPSLSVLDVGRVRPGALFSSDARYFANAGRAGVLQIWDLSARKLLREISPRKNSPNGPRIPLGFVRAGGRDWLFWGAISSSREFTLEGVSLDSGEPFPVSPGLRRPGVELFGSALSARYLVGPAPRRSDGEAVFCDLVSGARREFDHGASDVFRTVFAPDQEHFAALTRDGACELWRTDPLEPVSELRGFLQPVHSAAFSPDGARIAVGGNGGEAVKLWDVGSAQELLTLAGVGSMFDSISFSSDGNRLGAMNREGLLHIWRAPSLREIESPASP